MPPKVNTWVTTFLRKYRVWLKAKTFSILAGFCVIQPLYSVKFSRWRTWQSFNQ